MSVSIVAADSTRMVVKVPASIRLKARASRQSSELAAKKSMAVPAKTMVCEKCCFDIDNRRSAANQGIGTRVAAAPHRMWSASLAASSPTPFRNDEFIFDNQGRPKKYSPGIGAIPRL